MEATWRPSSSKANKIKAFKEHFSIKASAPTPVWDQEPRGHPLQLLRRNLTDALVSALANTLAGALPAGPAASAPPPQQLCRFFSNTDKCPQSCPLTGQTRPSSERQQKCPLSSVLPASFSVGQTKQCVPKKKRFFFTAAQKWKTCLTKWEKCPSCGPTGAPRVSFLWTTGIKRPRGDKESTEADQLWGHLKQKSERLRLNSFSLRWRWGGGAKAEDQRGRPAGTTPGRRS